MRGGQPVCRPLVRRSPRTTTSGKRGLSHVLLDRLAAGGAVPGPRVTPAEERRNGDPDQRAGGRGDVHRRRRTPDAAGALPEGAAGEGRHRHRVRHQQLRRVHRPPGRRGREVLHRAGRPGRRRRGDDHRGAGAERRPAPGAEGVPRDARPAVRVLHAGNDHGLGRPAQGEPGPERHRGPRGHRGQPLSLHRLPEHRPRGAAGRRRDARRYRRFRLPGRGRHRGRSARGGPGMTAVEDRATAEAPEREVGKARRRKEDARLITGRTTWTDNTVLPGMLHLAVVRSPVAHAKITAIDVSAAQQAPGVIAVVTGRDLADEQGSIPCAWPVTPDMVNPGHPSIAVDEVNHVGEAVAVIVARSRAAAADAIELVDVDYDVLPPCLDMEEAVAEGAQLTHDHLESNTSYHFVFDAGEAGTGTDTEQAFADAEVVVSRRFINQRLIPAFMEPRSVVVQPQGDNYTMWSATQVPHILRVMLASDRKSVV